MSCPTPSDFEDLLIDADASVCEQLGKLAPLSQKMWELSQCLLDSNGDLSDSFIQKICDAGCGGSGGTSTTTDVTTSGGGSDPPDASNDLTAYDENEFRRQTYQILTFAKPTGAESVSVWRNTTNNFNTATKVLDQETIYSFNDHSGIGDLVTENPDGDVLVHVDTDYGTNNNTEYYYWIKTHNSNGDSPVSNASAKVARLRKATGTLISRDLLTATAGSPYTITTATKVQFKLVAGGGAGAGGDVGNGGGGGGGGGTVFGEITVTGGDTIYADRGSTSPAGGGNSANGTDADDTIFYKNGVEVARALGGGGGVFNGAGGAGNGGTNTSATNYSAQSGVAGADEAAGVGGRTGHAWLKRAYPQRAISTPDDIPTGGAWGTMNPGGGSDSADDGTELPFATGGAGSSGLCWVVLEN